MVSVCGSDVRGPSCPPWRVRPKPTVPWWWAVLLLWCCCTQTRSDACAAAEGDDGTALLLCRSCGHEVTTGADLHPVRSPLALSHRNDSRLGDEPLHVQVLQNPHGHRFEVITFKAADVAKRWPADGGASWFPGFAWTVASCPRCGAHLGKSPNQDPEPGTRARYNAPPPPVCVPCRVGLPAQRVAPHGPGEPLCGLGADLCGSDRRPPVEGRPGAQAPGPQVLLQLTATPPHTDSLNPFNWSPTRVLHIKFYCNKASCTPQI